MRPTRNVRTPLLTGLLSLLALAALAGEIVLRPSDLIQLKISAVPINDVRTVSGQYRIDGQGYVNLPNLGQIKIAGLALDAAQTVIEKAYRSRDIYTNPAVAITLVLPHR